VDANEGAATAISTSHQHLLPRYRLAQPGNQPNGQFAAPARVEEGEGVKRDWRGERIAGQMRGRMVSHPASFS
jgi:hypothetical protein